MKDLRALLSEYQHEQVLFCNDDTSGLFAIIAIHDTTLGPALGGSRMWKYDSTEEALIDALRLSRGMTYKAALAGVHLGGGKSVIFGDPKTDKSESLFRMFGQYVNSLGGRYITAEDVGINVEDIAQVMTETRYVVGGPVSQGGSGDPSPFTAFGTYQGICASLYAQRGNDSVKGVSVAVQGVGNVGRHLIKHLVEDGAKVFVSDIDAERVKNVVAQYPGVEAVDPKEIFGLKVDVLAPCALGAVINNDSIETIKAKIIAGAANNQLAEEYHGEVLHKKGIYYAPDYLINAGGLINVYLELIGYNKERATTMVSNIYNTLLNIYKTSKEKNIPTSQAANMLAEERIRQVAHVKRRRFYQPSNI